MSEKLSIAVCDDESRAAAIISASVSGVFHDMDIDLSLETFLAPAELLERMAVRAFDLIFLDISMPKMDGIKLGKELQARGSTAAIVFVSSRTDLMIDTFAVEPFGFVRKNRFMDDLNDVITRFVEKRKKGGGDTVCFKDGQGTVSIDISRVKYVECERNAQILHFEDRGAIHKIYSRMETLEAELAKYGFIRIHKGYLVNSRYIGRFEATTLVLSTGEELPVGRSRRQEAMAAFMSYIGRSGVPYIGGKG